MADILTQKLPLVSGKLFKLKKNKARMSSVTISGSQVFWFIIFLLDIGVVYVILHLELIIQFLNWIDPK